MAPLVFIVDPDLDCVSRLAAIAEASGWSVAAESTFDNARSAICERAPSVVITNMRLGAFNGIHLAYITKQANPNATVVVYSDTEDPVLAREVRSANAVYEQLARLLHSLPLHLGAEPPPQNRRRLATSDRRRRSRGGRRTTDLI